MFRRDDADNPSTRDYGDHTEYGGGPGCNLRSPGGMPRRLAVQEEAQEMRRQGLRDEVPTVRLTRPDRRH